ncbi:MAG: thioether cross-link-forming SCIFF peptide maturase, partial [Clostridia bacterium]|nr:thioether cross-link-forming SCIFF peptide maturase [Clostridia bacterium]
MIHQFKQGGLCVVVDVFSGAIHLVDDVAYDIIALYETTEKEQIVNTLVEKYAHENLSREEIGECYDEITELKNDGKLFSPDTFAPISNKLKEKTSGVVKALCLHVAHTCNLNCAYCFASQGKYSGERAVMSEEVGKRAL